MKYSVLFKITTAWPVILGCVPSVKYDINLLITVLCFQENRSLSPFYSHYFSVLISENVVRKCQIDGDGESYGSRVQRGWGPGREEWVQCKCSQASLRPGVWSHVLLVSGWHWLCCWDKGEVSTGLDSELFYFPSWLPGIIQVSDFPPFQSFSTQLVIVG